MDKLRKEQEVMMIYKVERIYQRMCFGEYEDIKNLNLSSFISFIEEYLQRAKKAYCGKWDTTLPPWLNNCKEMEEGSAPVKAYEELIKVMALAGAAIETYCDIDANQWRPHPSEDATKWQK